MTETHFTPGPWTEIADLDVSLDTGGESSCVIFGRANFPVGVAFVKSAFSLGDTLSANLALLNAAPDLYAALEALLNDVCEMKDVDLDVIYEGRNGSLSKAKTALKKARGES